MQESITASLLRLLVLLLILAAIIFAGWNEPLRNRFVNPQELEAFTEPETEPVQDSNWMWEPGRTAVDQGAYKSGSQSRYRPAPERRRTLDR